MSYSTDTVKRIRGDFRQAVERKPLAAPQRAKRGTAKVAAVSCARYPKDPVTKWYKSKCSVSVAPLQMCLGQVRTTGRFDKFERHAMMSSAAG